MVCSRIFKAPKSYRLLMTHNCYLIQHELCRRLLAEHCQRCRDDPATTKSTRNSSIVLALTVVMHHAQLQTCPKLDPPGALHVSLSG
jgi:hypothetical protein